MSWEEHIATIIAVNALLVSMSVSAVAVRLFRPTAKKFEAHDVFLVLAAICGTAMSVLLCTETRYVLKSNHGFDLPLESTTFWKIFLALMICYMACNMFVKLALLSFYRYLTADVNHRRCIWFMTFVAIGFGVSSILVLAFECSPVSRVWNVFSPGTCINVIAFYYANAVIMISSDIVLYVMPMVFIRNLQLNRSKRIVINILFGLGSIVLFSSIMRLIAVHALAKDGSIVWNMAMVLMWSAIENHLAIFIACAPAIKATILHIFPSLKTFFTSTGRSNSNPSESKRSGASFKSGAPSLRRMSAIFTSFLFTATTKSKNSSNSNGTSNASSDSTILVTRDIDMDSYYRKESNADTVVDEEMGTGKGIWKSETIVEIDSVMESPQRKSTSGFPTRPPSPDLYKL